MAVSVWKGEVRRGVHYERFGSAAFVWWFPPAGEWSVCLRVVWDHQQFVFRGGNCFDLAEAARKMLVGMITSHKFGFDRLRDGRRFFISLCRALP